MSLLIGKMQARLVQTPTVPSSLQRHMLQSRGNVVPGVHLIWKSTNMYIGIAKLKEMLLRESVLAWHMLYAYVTVPCLDLLLP